MIPQRPVVQRCRSGNPGGVIASAVSKYQVLWFEDVGFIVASSCVGSLLETLTQPKPQALSPALDPPNKKQHQEENVKKGAARVQHHHPSLGSFILSFILRGFWG